MRVPRRRRQSVAVPLTVCRQRRLSLNMSQDRLAELSKVPQLYISRMERGEHIHIRQEDIKAVAEVLGIEPDTLMNEVTV